MISNASHASSSALLKIRDVCASMFFTPLVGLVGLEGLKFRRSE